MRRVARGTIVAAAGGLAVVAALRTPGGAAVAGARGAPPATAGVHHVGPPLPVRVRVVDGEGRPVAGAVVRAAAAEDPYAVPSVEMATTDADGEAQVALPRPAVGGGRGALLGAASADGRSATVRPSPPAPDGGTLLVLETCAAVEGRIADWPRGGIPGAVILIHCPAWPEGPGRRTVIPDAATGTFTVRGLHGYASLYALADGRCPSRLWRGTPLPGAIVPVELALGPVAVPAEVGVDLPDGSPAPEGTVALVRTGDRAWLRTRCGDGGRLPLPGVAEGEGIEIVVPAIGNGTNPGWTTVLLRRELARIEVAARQRLALPPAAEVAFRLVDAAGRALPDRRLRFQAAAGALVVPVRGSAALRSDGGGLLRPTDSRAHPEGEYVLVDEEAGEIWRGVARAAAGASPVIPVIVPGSR